MNPYSFNTRKSDGIVNRALWVVIQHSFNRYTFVITELDKYVSPAPGVCYRCIYLSNIPYHQLVRQIECQVCDREIRQIPFVDIHLDCALLNLTLVDSMCDTSDRGSVLTRIDQQHIPLAHVCRIEHQLIVVVIRVCLSLPLHACVGIGYVYQRTDASAAVFIEDPPADDDQVCGI